jgi:uncharacterized membrane protein YkoI
METRVAGDEVAFGRRAFVSGLLAATIAILAPSSAPADRRRRRDDDKDDDDDGDDNDYGHEAAQRARAAGEIAPLSEIIDRVRKAHEGEVVGVELEREGGRWIYEIKLITPRNRYLEIYVDARSRAIMKVEGE